MSTGAFSLAVICAAGAGGRGLPLLTRERSGRAPSGDTSSATWERSRRSPATTSAVSVCRIGKFRTSHWPSGSPTSRPSSGPWGSTDSRSWACPAALPWRSRTRPAIPSGSRAWPYMARSREAASARSTIRSRRTRSEPSSAPAGHGRRAPSAAFSRRPSSPTPPSGRWAGSTISSVCRPPRRTPSRAGSPARRSMSWIFSRPSGCRRSSSMPGATAHRRSSMRRTSRPGSPTDGSSRSRHGTTSSSPTSRRGRRSDERYAISWSPSATPS